MLTKIRTSSGPIVNFRTYRPDYFHFSGLYRTRGNNVLLSMGSLHYLSLLIHSVRPIHLARPGGTLTHLFQVAFYTPGGKV